MQSVDVPANRAEEFMQGCRFQLLVSRRLPLGAAWHLDLCSPFWRLYINDRSGACLHFEGRRIPMDAGEIWLIPSWVRFQTSCQGAVTQDFLHFQMLTFSHFVSHRLFQRPLSPSASPPLRALARRWRGSFESDTTLSDLFWASALIQASLAESLESANDFESFRRKDEDEALLPALHFLEKNFLTAPANRQLARLCGMSEDYFIRRFRKTVGTSPARFCTRKRLESVADWLASTNLTLEEIAESAGFTDRFYLSRVFKSRFGLPPAAYRRMHRRER